MSDVLTRCPYCAQLQYDRQEGRCRACSWTGKCNECDVELSANGDSPTFCSNRCAWQADQYDRDR